MKKLLLTTAVLAGMGASQVFADASDAWTGTIALTTVPQCVLSDDGVDVSLKNTVAGALATTANAAPAANVTTATFTDTATIAAIDSNGDGLNNEDFEIDILIKGQSYCNYSHAFGIARQHNAFVFSGDLTSTSAISAESDAFYTAIPFALSVDAGTWDKQVTDDVAFAQLAYDAGTIIAFATSAPANETAWAALTKDGETSVLRYHNDGDATTPAGAAKGGLGLQISLDYTAPTTGVEQDLPLLSGTYTERLYLKVGASL